MPKDRRKGERRLNDSGLRRRFKGGAVRDGATMKGRFDLIGVAGALRYALQMERGAAKYSARNWEKGMPLSVFLNSAFHHIMAFMGGFDDEPHLDGAIWNLECLAEGQARIKMGLWPKEMDDLPHTYKGKNFQEFTKLIRELMA